MGEVNFGKYLQKKLHELERSQEWLYRRSKVSTGSCQRWSNGQEPSLSAFLRVCRVIANQEQRSLLEVIEEYLEKK